MAKGTLGEWISRVNQLFRQRKPVDTDSIEWIETDDGMEGHVNFDQLVDEPILEDLLKTIPIWPAKIDQYTGGTDTHRVDIYANGFDDPATEEDIDLNSICNLPANKSLAVGTPLFVIKASDEYIGLVAPMTKVTCVTSVQLDGSNNLQIKTTDVYAFAPDAASAWTTVTGWTTTNCST